MFIITPVDIMHAIVSTEEKARSLYLSAKEKEDLFNAGIEEDSARIRSEIFAAAETEIAAFDEAETTRADRAIEDLDRRLTGELAAASASFQKHKSALIDRVFKKVVSDDA